MFGAPDTAPDGELTSLNPTQTPDQERAGLLFAPLPERRWRELTLWLALAASLVFHGAVVLLLPLRSSTAGDAAPVASLLGPDERIEPLYLFPYLQHDRTEKPERPDVPLSDRDRRAHGGQGAPSPKPGGGQDGMAPWLVPPPPSTGGASGGAVVPPGAHSESDQGSKVGEGQSSTDQGKALVLQLPRPGQADSTGRLKGLPSLGPGEPGSGGSGVGRGGLVDLGPISFDTRWYDWGPYAREMLRRIRYHWQIPEIAQLGVPGVVRIRFYIERDGKVTGLSIEQISGHPSMDFAARDAILDGSPLPPLPADLTGVEREGVTITFYYNSEAPEWSGERY